jgi:ABC-type transporter Mla MlaB component
MTPDLDVQPSPPATDTFAASTVQCDARRAELEISGVLDVDAAAVLDAMVGAQVRAGRRYLRVNVAPVTRIDSAALGVLSRLHRRLLACRGTLILTGVTGRHERVLAHADPTLLLLPPTAAEPAT